MPADGGLAGTGERDCGAGAVIFFVSVFGGLGLCVWLCYGQPGMVDESWVGVMVCVCVCVCVWYSQTG